MRYATMMLVLALVGPVAAEPPPMRCLILSHTWDGAQPLSAATAPADARAPLAIDQPATVQLSDAASVRFAVPLGKPASPGDKGGLIALHVTHAGTYQVAIQHRAWIDIVRRGRSLASIAHAHGGLCSGIAKTVDFRLARGDYILQLSGSQDDTTGLRMTR